MSSYVAAVPAEDVARLLEEDLAFAALSGLLAGLYLRVAGPEAAAGTLDAVVTQVSGGSREVQLGLVQAAADLASAREARRTDVTGADGITRTRAETGRVRQVSTRFGTVRVRRIGYRAPGAQDLFPLDAVLSLPPCRDGYDVQLLAAGHAVHTAYRTASSLAEEAAGVRIGHESAQRHVRSAAADTDAFWEQRVPPAPPGDDAVLICTLDGKGVDVLPAARRDSRKKHAEASLLHHQETGMKSGSKRMCEVGCTYWWTPAPPGQRRTAGDILGYGPARPGTPPRPADPAYRTALAGTTADLAASLFAESDRRDAAHTHAHVVIADGNTHQIDTVRKLAADRGITLHIIIDLMHVLEYLWKAAVVFHGPRNPAAEHWQSALAWEILAGRTQAAITMIEDAAAARPPKPGGEHAKIISTTLTYLRNKLPYLSNYPRALAEGWPIASGVIEGACRHIVADRLAITGARWSLPGAQAMLNLRALHASGQSGTYWTYHLQQEHHRNHTSRYQEGFNLTA